MTPAVATFAAINDAVYDLLKPFILFYVAGASTVSTVASSRHRPGNVRLVMKGQRDGAPTTGSLQLTVKSYRNQKSDPRQQNR
jgi:hypothetical protein